MVKIKILEPVAAPKVEEASYAPKPTTLEGGTLGLLSNGWRSFNTLIDAFAELALNKYGIAKVTNRKHWNGSGLAPEEYYDDLAQCDAVITGLAH